MKKRLEDSPSITRLVQVVRLLEPVYFEEYIARIQIILLTFGSLLDSIVTSRFTAHGSLCNAERVLRELPVSQPRFLGTSFTRSEIGIQSTTAFWWSWSRIVVERSCAIVVQFWIEESFKNGR